MKINSSASTAIIKNCNSLNLVESKSFKTSSSSSLRIFPSNLPSTASLKNIKSCTINDVLLNELNQAILSLENEIELGLENLENETEMMDSSLEMEELISLYPELVFNIAEKGTGFLSSFLPNLPQIEKIQPQLELTGRIANLAGLFLAASTNGAQLVAIVCKNNMLKLSKELLKTRQAELNSIQVQGPNATMSPKEKAKLEKILKQWEINIAVFETDLRKETIDVGITTSLNGLYVALEIANTLPLRYLPTYLQGSVAQIIGFSSHILSVVSYAITFSHHFRNFQTFNAWTKDYQLWQKNSTFTPSVVQSVENLLKKRQQLIAHKKNLVTAKFDVMQPEIMARSRLTHQYLFKDLPSTSVEAHFQNWYKVQPKEQLIQDYIERQEIVEFTLKNALKEIIHQKHQLEKKFFMFDLYSSGTTYAIALTSLILSIGLAILTPFAVPVAVAGLILLGASLASTTCTIGFLTMNYINHRVLKPQSTKSSFSFTVKITWNRLKKTVYVYKQKAKIKKLQKVSQQLTLLHLSTRVKKTDPIYIQTKQKFRTAKADLEQNQARIKEWENEVQKYERILAQKGWEDFIPHASLINSTDPTISPTDRISFDSLRAFTQALTETNVKLLGEDTKCLLEKQLGLDLKKLQKQLKDDPDAIRSALQGFASLNTSDLIALISEQKA